MATQSDGRIKAAAVVVLARRGRVLPMTAAIEPLAGEVAPNQVERAWHLIHAMALDPEAPVEYGDEKAKTVGLVDDFGRVSTYVRENDPSLSPQQWD